MSFAWDAQEEDVDEVPFTYYNLALAKSALNALRSLHEEVQGRRIELAGTWSEPIGQYVESDAAEDGRALIEAYWDCALVIWDCTNRDISALCVGEEQTVEDAVRDIGFALKVIDRMGLANW